jgi:hypothetical protein
VRQVRRVRAVLARVVGVTVPFCTLIAIVLVYAAWREFIH